MNNDKLILESLNWLLSNSNPANELEDRERQELFGRIDDAVNPEPGVTIAERTHDALSQSSEVKKHE